MAQPRSWAQTPAHWPRQVPIAWGNPVTYVRTPVQHTTLPVAQVVRPLVVQPPLVQPMHPPAPRWIYAAPLKQHSSAVQSSPGANAVPKVVAVNVGAPRAKKDNLLIEGRVATDKGVETITPANFKRMWEQNLFERFE